MGCTGSAFVVGVAGRDVYAWTTRGAVPRLRVAARVAGVPLRTGGTARKRVTWRAQGFNVWVQAGPQSHRLPRLAALARIVRATRTVAR